MRDGRWHEAGLPAITISMPVRNAQRFIVAAIASIQRQDDVDFELIVVDDASTDGTAATVAALLDDPRIILIRNAIRRGRAYCHNRVIARSRAPYIAHVAASDILSYGALRAMLDKLDSDSGIGLAYCYFFDIDSRGKITRDAFHHRRQRVLTRRRHGLDDRMDLLVHGMTTVRLYTYRKAVFEVVGRFDETRLFGNNDEMVMRVANRFEVAQVPRFLYGRRRHNLHAKLSQTVNHLGSWSRRCWKLYRLKNKKHHHAAPWSGYNLKRLLLANLTNLLGLPTVYRTLKQQLQLLSGVKMRLQKKWRSFCKALYYRTVACFSWLPEWYLSTRPIRRVCGRQPHRVGYYQWRFPILSETFIRREITALIQAGIDVRIFSDAPGDGVDKTELTAALCSRTHYLLPMATESLAAYRKLFLKTKPFTFLCLKLCVYLYRYDSWKTFSGDHRIFDQAIYLAGLMQDAGITHVHSPWADRAAFILLIAARLMRVPFTLQARAHELYHSVHLYAVGAKFRGATAIITNSFYNQRRIRQLVAHRQPLPIHVIYEGLDLTRIDSTRSSWRLGATVKLLCVARLVEQKGLIDLLAVCRRMAQEGRRFVCDIVGAPAVPNYTSYLTDLKRAMLRWDLKDKVRFRGAQSNRDVFRFYRQADIFVLPCVVDRFGGRDMTPNVLFEAMAMQLPVISTHLSAIPEIVEDGVSGLLVPPNDPRALYAALIRVMDDEGLRQTLGQNARQKIMAQFDLNQNIHNFIRLLADS